MGSTDSSYAAVPELGQYREFFESCVERISHKYQAKHYASDIVRETLAESVLVE